MGFGEYGERRVVTHRKCGLHAVLRHGENLVLDILVGIAEHLVKAVSDDLRVHGDLPVGDRECIQVQKVPVQPFAVRASSRIIRFTLLIGDDPLLSCVHQKNTAGFESRLFHDVLRLDV